MNGLPKPKMNECVLRTGGEREIKNPTTRNKRIEDKARGPGGVWVPEKETPINKVGYEPEIDPERICTGKKKGEERPHHLLQI